MEEWNVTVEVDGRNIPLNEFVRGIIGSAIVAMVKVLKGVPEDLKTVTVRVERKLQE